MSLRLFVVGYVVVLGIVIGILAWRIVRRRQIDAQRRERSTRRERRGDPDVDGRFPPTDEARTGRRRSLAFYPST